MAFSFFFLIFNEWDIFSQIPDQGLTQYCPRVNVLIKSSTQEEKNSFKKILLYLERKQTDKTQDKYDRD